MITHRWTAIASALAVGSLLTVGLAACGGGGDAPTPKPPASSSSTPSATSSVAPTSEADPYLEVPDGVRLTAPGTSLSLGRRAVVAWVPRQEEVSVAEVKVTGIETTTIKKTFGGFDLDADQRASTPYLVRAKVTNVGERSLSDRLLPLYLATSKGLLLEATGVPDDFAACPGGELPPGFVPGQVARLCRVFLVPRGDTPISATFALPDGVEPVVWQGRVTELGAKDTDKAKKNKTKKKDESTSPTPAG